MRIKLTLAILLLWLAGACTKKDVEFDRISAYLSTQHGLQIPNDTTHFFIFPSKGCQSCARSFFQYLLELDFEENNAFIIAHGDYSPLADAWDRRVLWDSKGHISRIDLGIAATAHIVTHRGKIIRKTEVHPSNVEELKILVVKELMAP